MIEGIEHHVSAILHKGKLTFFVNGMEMKADSINEAIEEYDKSLPVWITYPYQKHSILSGVEAEVLDMTLRKYAKRVPTLPNRL